MSRLGKKYLAITFLIELVCWGNCVILGFNGITLKENYILYIPYLLGGWSPTIASYISLKQEHRIRNIKEWFEIVFDLKHSLLSYVMVVIMGILYILPQCIVSGYSKGAPLFAIVFMIPMMLIGGGLEEAGWRCILQPELEKKTSFTLSTIIVSIVWWIWHLPLFYIEGVSQYGTSYLAFGVSIVGLSFALASIRHVTKSVWLCVLNRRMQR